MGMGWSIVPPLYPTQPFFAFRFSFPPLPPSFAVDFNGI